MNILFVLKTTDIGGVEIVTAVLANRFVAEGHKVTVWAFEKGESSIDDRFDPRVEIVTHDGLNASEATINAMRSLLRYKQIDVVINQWGLPPVPTRVVNEARRGTHVRMVTVYHNLPSANGRIQGVDKELETARNSIKRALLHGKRRLFKWVTARSMRRNYHAADRYVVLSPTFVDVFKEFTGLKDAPKLAVQTNPVTIDCSGFAYAPEAKQKEVVYVGRLDTYQKRVDRILDTWAIVEKAHPDWRLTLVGDGPERAALEAQARQLGLKNVAFEGFASPRPYYERASVLVMCSEFEGFPLVLAEAMSFGVVPVVYDSFPAVHDIVADGLNGAIVSADDGFSPLRMAQALNAVINGDLPAKARHAIDTATRFAPDVVCRGWNKILSF